MNNKSSFIPWQNQEGEFDYQMECILFQKINWIDKYHKSSLRGIIKEGGLLERGTLFKKLDEEDIYDSAISLSPHILRVQDAILRVRYINSTDFHPKLYQNLHANVFKQSRKKILGNFWDSLCVGGLIELL